MTRSRCRFFLVSLIGSVIIGSRVDGQGVGGQVVALPVTPQVVVSAEGEARVVPDRAAITLGVQSRGATAASAAGENARKQKAIIDTLRALGISGDQIGTQNFGVSPEMAYDPKTQQSRVTGYVVSNNVRVEVKAIDLVSRAIDASLAKGANQISSLEFRASNPDELRRTALAQAVARARADADVLARTAGGSLGALLELTSSALGGPPVIVRGFSAEAAMAKVATPIEPGTETLRVGVTARWQFIPSPK
jgi:uncharacterized protein